MPKGGNTQHRERLGENNPGRQGRRREETKRWPSNTGFRVHDSGLQFFLLHFYIFPFFFFQFTESIVEIY